MTRQAPLLIACGASPQQVLPSERIGSKAHHLARMAAQGLPVPPAFVLDAEWCHHEEDLDPHVWRPALKALEDQAGLRFGDPARPLLVSVRSGAAVSMPGMMETLLDVGLNDRSVEGLVRMTGNPRMAWDAYARLVCGFGEVVLGIPSSAFEEDVHQVMGETADAPDFSQARAIARRHLETVRRLGGKPFPQDPQEQLEIAIRAVMHSWKAPKAVAYRRLHGIPESMGTAVTVQHMVFGNAGGMSGAGVGFTRHPSTGEPIPWIDFLFDAQGEDVVSGRRAAHGHEALARTLPAAWQALQQAMQALEAEFGDMQDFEFTVEDGRLFLLQSRSGKRTPKAAVRIALDLLEEGRIDRKEALARVHGIPDQVLSDTVLAVDGAGTLTVLADAISTCTGIASGEIALDSARACERHTQGATVILVRHDAETADIEGLQSSSGLLTRSGARTSHAAVVARQMGRVCLVGCSAMEIDMVRRSVRFGDACLPEGATISLDGNDGRVLPGVVQVRQVPDTALLSRLAALKAQESQPSPLAAAAPA